MKKFKALVLIAALLLSVLLLASCAESKDMQDLFDGTAYVDDTPSVTAAVQVEALKGATYQSQAAELVYLTDIVIDGENSHQKNIVYNLKTNAVVFEATATLTTDIDVTLGTQYDAGYFLVETTTWQLVDGVNLNYEYKTALVAANGTVLAEVDGRVAPSTQADLIAFDGKCYRIAKDGTIAYAFDLGDFATLPTITAKTEKYYYYIDASGNEVLVYDLNCRLVAYYTMPDYAAAMQAYPLAGGDVLIQYIVAEPDDAEDYTFLLPTGSYYGTTAPGKYTLHSLLLRSGKNKTKELDLDYFIVDVDRMTDDSWVEAFGLSDDCDNLATAVEIADQRVDTSATAYRAIVLSDSGKVRGELEKLITAQTTVIPSLINTNRWIVSNADSGRFLVNEKGYVIGEVTGYDARNESYYLVGGKLYDYNLTAVYDYEDADLEVYNDYEGVLNHGVLFENKDGEIICYTNGNSTTVIAKDSARSLHTVTDGYFVVRDATDPANIKYDIYNDVGTKLVTLDYAPTTVMTAENGVCLLSYLQSDGKSVYYRIG